MGAGGSFHSWVAVVICGCWASFMAAGSLSVATGTLFGGAGSSIVGGGAHLCGRVVCGCLLVLCGRGGDMSSAVWSLLARMGRGWGYSQ